MSTTSAPATPPVALHAATDTRPTSATITTSAAVVMPKAWAEGNDECRASTSAASGRGRSTTAFTATGTMPPRSTVADAKKSVDASARDAPRRRRTSIHTSATTAAMRNASGPNTAETVVHTGTHHDCAPPFRSPQAAPARSISASGGQPVTTATATRQKSAAATTPTTTSARPTRGMEELMPQVYQPRRGTTRKPPANRGFRNCWGTSTRTKNN